MTMAHTQLTCAPMMPTGKAKNSELTKVKMET